MPYVQNTVPVSGFTLTTDAITINTRQRAEFAELEITHAIFTYEAGATVKLIKSGESDITAQDVEIDIDENKKPIVKCKFAIPAGATQGDWNVKLTNPQCDEDADGGWEPARSSNVDKVFTIEPSE